MSTPEAQNTHALAALADKGICRPTHERNNTVTGVVHLGLGAFRLSHRALGFDDLLAVDGLQERGSAASSICIDTGARS